MQATTVKERPILFSGPMVCALLAGRKTQTRRVVKPQPPTDRPRHCWFDAPVYGWTSDPEPTADWFKVRCPYGEPGDRLWVRETFKDHTPFLPDLDPGETVVLYRANDPRPEEIRWTPSIHMPRWASRILLEVTEVRVERLHSISEADKIAEGATPEKPFGTVWRAINTKPGIRWEDNPWVWVVSFRRINAEAK